MESLLKYFVLNSIEIFQTVKKVFDQISSNLLTIYQVKTNNHNREGGLDTRS